ncbi:MAG: FHA domain-containing protein [Acetatifactor sp.]|nr:FHA domain-containing protein [Acetatifactor sp.]
MNVIVCKNGHYYDADAYELCPHCGEEGASVESAKTPKKKHFWNHNKSDDKQPVSQQKKEFVDKTWAMEMGSTETDHPQPQPERGETIALKYSNVLPDSQFADTNESQDDMSPTERTETIPQAESDLMAAVKRASANPEGKTVGFFRMTAQRNAEADISGISEFVEPPVGWLVCVQGIHFGKCFSIVAGRNSIGRYDTNDIVLDKDDSVSRDKHAWIIYEPRKRIFYLKPGEGNALTYLNDNMVEESNELAKLDRIELGNTTLLFIPLCGDDFCWESYIKGES